MYACIIHFSFVFWVVIVILVGISGARFLSIGVGLVRVAIYVKRL